MFDERVSEYDTRIEFLLGITSPFRRADAVIQLASGVPAGDVFSPFIDPLRLLPHIEALTKLTTELEGDPEWPTQRAEILADILQRQIDAETRRRVSEELTRPLLEQPPPSRSRAIGNDGEAVLEVALQDNVNVGELRALLSMVTATYAMSLVAERLQQREGGNATLDWDAIRRESNLTIHSIEIGTPNWLRVRGRAKHIAAVATLLTTILGAPVAGTQAYKNFQDGQKSRAEARKVQAETTVSKLDAIERANRLYSEGKLSREALDEVYRTAGVLIREAPTAGAIVKSGGLAVIGKPASPSDLSAPPPGP